MLKRNGTGTEDRIYLGGYELYRRRNGHGVVVEEIESLHLFEGEQRVLLVDDVLVADSQPGPNGLKVKQQTLWRYQYDNHLGSATAELDDTAGVISYEEFHPYGTSAYRLLSSAAEAPAKRYRFTGMERDEETGLSYHAARYLIPQLGRWISCDPIGVAGAMCLYEYCSGNPARFTDRSGHVSPEESKTIDELLAWRQANKPAADRVSNLLTDHAAAMERHDQAAADVKWAAVTAEVQAQQHQEDRGFIKNFLVKAAAATVGAVGWEAGIVVAGAMELGVGVSMAFAGLTSASAGVTFEEGRRAVAGEQPMSSKEVAGSLVTGMAIPLVVHGAVKLDAKLGTVPALPEVAPPSPAGAVLQSRPPAPAPAPAPGEAPGVAEFEAAGGQRIFYIAEYRRITKYQMPLRQSPPCVRLETRSPSIRRPTQTSSKLPRPPRAEQNPGYTSILAVEPTEHPRVTRRRRHPTSPTPRSFRRISPPSRRGTCLTSAPDRSSTSALRKDKQRSPPWSRRQPQRRRDGHVHGGLVLQHGRQISARLVATHPIRQQRQRKCRP